MLTGKERAQYRKEANGLETIMQIGKGGLEETSIRQIDEALTARELIKIRVLETCSESVREIATAAAEATNSECIQVIGSKFVLWRKKPEHPIVIAPAASAPKKPVKKPRGLAAKFAPKVYKGKKKTPRK